MVYCFIRGTRFPEKYAFKKNYDFFELGYIEESDPTTINVITYKQKKPKHKEANPSVKNVDHPLFDDCCLVLKSLGYKTSQAKRLCNQIFDNNNISTIEQFVSIAATC
jgi:hypothetical protein